MDKQIDQINEMKDQLDEFEGTKYQGRVRQAQFLLTQAAELLQKAKTDSDSSSEQAQRIGQLIRLKSHLRLV